jgi:hypothetical protein
MQLAAASASFPEPTVEEGGRLKEPHAATATALIAPTTTAAAKCWPAADRLIAAWVTSPKCPPTIVALHSRSRRPE